MNPLTADEMACVAREILNFGFARPSPEELWDPENEDYQWRMLVEWLADKLLSGSKFIKYSANIEFIAAIEKRDINALQRMVLELRNPQ